MPAHLTQDQIDLALNLRSKCWTLQRIASRIGVHKSSVSRALARHDQRVNKRLASEDRTLAEKVAQLEQLGWMAGELVDAWERSKRPAVRKRIKYEIVSAGRGETVEVPVGAERTTIRRDGNPQFLAAAAARLAERRALLAIDARLDFDKSKLTGSDDRDARHALLVECRRKIEGH